MGDIDPLGGRDSAEDWAWPPFHHQLQVTGKYLPFHSFRVTAPTPPQPKERDLCAGPGKSWEFLFKVGIPI